MRKMIYIADDMGTIRRSLERTLRVLGYMVHSFASGNELIDAAKHVTPDLVITDMVMDNGDGYDVLRALRGRAPVIAMSGRQPLTGFGMSNALLDMAKVHDAVAVIEKSSDPRPLLDAVAAALAE